jgi:hypothetical protein
MAVNVNLNARDLWPSRISSTLNSTVLQLPAKTAWLPAVTDLEMSADCPENTGQNLI